MPRYKTQAKTGTAEHTRRLQERTDARFRDLYSCAYGNVMAYLEYRQLTGKKFTKGKLYKSMFDPPFEQGEYTDPVSEKYTVFNSHYLTRADLMKRSFNIRNFLHQLWKKETNKKERFFIAKLINKVHQCGDIWMEYCVRTDESHAIDKESDELYLKFKQMKRTLGKKN